jgi:hypothetical protein
MRETVRSGRRANFFITENNFIDHYARDARPLGIAVYHVLERYADCHTRSTWISTAKMADLLGYSPRQIQRTLKTLQDLKLIRILQTDDRTTYVVDPVPPRKKNGTTPLFDHVPDPLSSEDINENNEPTPMSLFATPVTNIVTGTSQTTTSVSQCASRVTRFSDTRDALYKEEQDLLNKTQEQDLLNKTFGKDTSEIYRTAQRVLRTLGLPSTVLEAAVAAVELKTKATDLSMDGVVQEICTEAHHAYRRRVSGEEFLADFLAQTLAQRILDEINLPPTNNVTTIVKAALKAEAKDVGLGLEETAARITTAAIEDRRSGAVIDRFYFENCKWRSNGGVSKAERRKLDNLEVNARVKQRLRERLGASRVDQR